jgi:hypothetical protein
MAKGQDPFEKFKAATLSGPSIKDAISPAPAPKAESKPVAAAAPVETPAPVAEPKAKKGANEEQVSFFIDKDLKRQFGMLKYELGVQFKDLYEEAITDLLKKYHKL